MKKRGQISVEYIMIITIAFMIIIPGVYLFRNYALESNDKLMERKLADISNQILMKARKMYYYGPPSKSMLSIEMPSGIERMYVISIPSNDEYYIAFAMLTADGEKEFLFDSDIPLRSGDTLCDDVDYVDCSDPDVYCECFPERYYSDGIKNFQISADESCIGNPSCIVLEEISSRLS